MAHKRIKNLGVFGSYVQGKQNADSDIDILLELEKPVRIDLIALIELEYQLSDLLGVKVDLTIIDIVWKTIKETIPLHKPIFQQIAEDHKE